MLRLFPRVLLSLVLFAAFAEVAAVGVHYAETGWLFYANPHRRTHAVLPPEAAQTLTGDALHPYFGPTHRPGLPFDIPPALQNPAHAQRPSARTNNFGFVSRQDYPVRRANDRQFFVGLFGGSVGLWFCEVGAEPFFDRLRRSPALAGREIVPVCLAHEGYKQPQQLLALTYFLSIGQPFDLVVNIDGFNEVALGAMNDQRGYDFTMPSVSHLEPMMNLIDRATLTPGKAAVLAEITEARQSVDRWARRTNAARSAAVYVVADRLHGLADTRYRAARVRFDQLPSQAAERSLIRITPKTAQRQGEAFFAEVARQWAEASGEMQTLLAARGIPYVHLLQPNQYASTRTFSQAERQVAFFDASPFKSGAAQGYPHLLGEPARRILAARGVRFVDATGAFDRTAGQVYWDNCCHYTRLGNEVLAGVVADAVMAPGVLSAR